MCTAHNRFRPMAICFDTLKAHYYRHHGPPLEHVSIALLVLAAAKLWLFICPFLIFYLRVLSFVQRFCWAFFFLAVYVGSWSRLPFIYLYYYALQFLKAYYATWIRRSNFRHQASPRMSPRERTQRWIVELWARNVR